jgi:hypothetical protein
VVTWPSWSTYFPTGNWLTTPPTTALTSGTAPSQGVSVTGPFPVVYTYSYTVSNTLLCFQGAQVREDSGAQQSPGYILLELLTPSGQQQLLLLLCGCFSNSSRLCTTAAAAATAVTADSSVRAAAVHTNSRLLWRST